VNDRASGTTAPFVNSRSVRELNSADAENFPAPLMPSPPPNRSNAKLPAWRLTWRARIYSVLSFVEEARRDLPEGLFDRSMMTQPGARIVCRHIFGPNVLNKILCGRKPFPSEHRLSLITDRLETTSRVIFPYPPPMVRAFPGGISVNPPGSPHLLDTENPSPLPSELDVVHPVDRNEFPVREAFVQREVKPPISIPRTLISRA